MVVIRPLDRAGIMTVTLRAVRKEDITRFSTLVKTRGRVLQSFFSTFICRNIPEKLIERVCCLLVQSFSRYLKVHSWSNPVVLDKLKGSNTKFRTYRVYDEKIFSDSASRFPPSKLNVQAFSSFQTTKTLESTANLNRFQRCHC